MEIWKDISGYEGLYQISNLSNVKSLSRYVSRKNQNNVESGYFTKEKIMKPRVDKDGYLYVGLYKNKKVNNFKIHRLVALAFIANPNNYPLINHKNEIKNDNRISNLEWCDYKYNANYGSCREKISKKLMGNKNNKWHKRRKIDE